MLSAFNRHRLLPTLPDDTWRFVVVQEQRMRVLEGEFLEQERRCCHRRALTAPTEPQAFLRWFADLRESGPGQHDPLFPWLATHAKHEEVRWLIHEELAGDVGFEDLLALSQIKLPRQAKLELARKYWDEVGDESGVFGPELSRISDAMELEESDTPIVWEVMAVANLMVGLAINRRYAYHSLGALAAIELTYPSRALFIQRALKRLGVQLKARHCEATSWNAEVMQPLVSENPAVAVALAEGALMRLEAERRCFERYRRELSVD
jgi:hypothetical protein